MDIPPDQHLTSVLFKICAHLRDAQSLDFGKQILDTFPIEFQNNVILLNSALRMLIECGDIGSAENFFSRMKKNLISYGTMMDGKRDD